ncbi:hypothetical protein RAS2_28480 [Phycisphaerae bacterium RAS2]|nr:hypothetical protein RAS2_28480 [Phycisphaerae bacterium RAS2]
MNDDRWKKIKEVFAGAAGRQGAEREAYLALACAGDADLRADVEALLDSELGSSPLGATPGKRLNTMRSVPFISIEDSE